MSFSISASLASQYQWQFSNYRENACLISHLADALLKVKVKRRGLLRPIQALTPLSAREVHATGLGALCACETWRSRIRSREQPQP